MNHHFTIYKSNAMPWEDIMLCFYLMFYLRKISSLRLPKMSNNVHNILYTLYLGIKKNTPFLAIVDLEFILQFLNHLLRHTGGNTFNNFKCHPFPIVRDCLETEIGIIKLKLVSKIKSRSTTSTKKNQINLTRLF